MKVYVIGSISCEDEIRRVAGEYERLGCEVKYVKSENASHLELIKKCFHTISEWADLVVVVPKNIDTELMDIGDGTKYEMVFARFVDKPVVINWEEGQSYGL